MSVDSREDHLGQRSWVPAHAGTQLTLGACRLSFAGPVTGARCLNPIPSRTRPLNASALMVLCLKTRESRSLPGLPRTKSLFMTHDAALRPPRMANSQWQWVLPFAIRHSPLAHK